MRKETRSHILVVVLLTMLGVVAFQLPCFAQIPEEEKPDRLITMSSEFTGITIPEEKDVNMDLIFNNKGKSGENVDVKIAEAPEGWKTTLKTYKFTVTGIHVPSGETKTLTFAADPNETIKPGDYTFRIEANTQDGQFPMTSTIKVTVVKKEEDVAKETKDIKLNTTYPVLRGPSDMTFEFSVEVNSELDQDSVFDLFAEGPKDWEVNFKPAYESKYITSLQIQANQNRNVSVEVKPAMDAQAGEYPIKLQVTSGEAKATVDLTVILTGTYKLDAGTPTGLLSLDARPGQSTTMSIYIKNTGSAANHDIKFMTFKPENWKVEFKPENLDTIEPGELKQIDMTITPYDDALVGDYSVGVEVQGEKASKTLEFRTTVKASAAWVGVGVIIIVGVIAGLTGLFRWLGRR